MDTTGTHHTTLWFIDDGLRAAEIELCDDSACEECRLTEPVPLGEEPKVALSPAA